MQAVLREACKDLFNLRIKAQTDRLDAPSEMKRNRKLIAQIKTLFRERELAQAKARSTAEANVAAAAAAE